MLRNTLLKATKVHYFPKLYNPNKQIVHEDEVDVDKCLAQLTKIAEGDDYSRGDLYWQRVLVQTQELDLAWINQQVKAWFVPMLQAIKREK